MEFPEKITYSLYHFYDVSEGGYGQARYLRMENENKHMNGSLIFRKSRVVPANYVSIPRLKLTANTLLVKIAMMLKEELDIHTT